MRVLAVPSLLVVLFLTVRCAGPASGPETARAVAPCLPAAVSSEFFFWPVIGFRSIQLMNEDGGLTPASWVLYRRGRTAVAAMWVQADLIAVDPDPETDNPEWVDLSLVVPMDGKLVLRRSPEAPCRWERWDVGTET